MAFKLVPPFDTIALRLLEDLGSVEAIEQLPYELLYKAMASGDSTHFVTRAQPLIRLDGIRGPYTVYDDDMAWLYTMNLHNGYFGATFPEIDYVSRLEEGSVFHVQFVTGDDELRSLLVIKSGPAVIPAGAPGAQVPG